jgi:hypothetical protein
VAVGVSVIVAVSVAVGVGPGVSVMVGDGVTVKVDVGDGVTVKVDVGVVDGVSVGVRVGDGVNVGGKVGVCVAVAVSVGSGGAMVGRSTTCAGGGGDARIATSAVITASVRMKNTIAMKLKKAPRMTVTFPLPRCLAAHHEVNHVTDHTQ